MKKPILCFLLSLPFWVSAGGFQLNSMSPKTAAMGGSVTGMAVDASATFFNPAALSKLQKNFINAGVAFHMPLTAFSGTSGAAEEMDFSGFPTPFLYGSYRLSGKAVIGVSVNTPFAFNSVWKEDWSGRYVSISSRLNSTYIQPALSYQLGKNLFLGAGPVLALSNSKQVRAIDLFSVSSGEARVQTEGGAIGFGFNAGLLATLGKTMVGINYRSAVSFKVEDGDAAFTNIPVLFILDGLYPEITTFSSSWTLPSVVSVGISTAIDDKVTLTGDISLTGWSVYDSVNMAFSGFPALDYKSPRRYDDSFSIRAGVQYAYNSKVTLRGGLAYETSPVQDGYVIPETADAGKFLFSGGISYQLKKGWSLDAALMIENLQERLETANVSANFNGNYKTIVYGAGLGLQKTF